MLRCIALMSNLYALLFLALILSPQGANAGVNNLRTGPAGLELIKRNEGVRLKAYKDPGGI